MGRNNYFQFKQFTVQQENAAMKVGTDGVLLGAWTDIEGVNSILDVGTGTGLIAIMLAQRSNANIVAIDNEPSACRDAKLNSASSPWSSRIEVVGKSLQDYSAEIQQAFDCVVCNPPFFTNSLKPVDAKRSLARHNDQLPFDALLKGVSSILSPTGHFSVILPITAEAEFRMLAANYRLFPSRITRVRPKTSVEPARVLLEFRVEGVLESENLLTIETEKHHEYQPEFIEMVNDFYLKL
jgi:tRNA1Val (adenine37-N6)-methyltransferase